LKLKSFKLIKDTNQCPVSNVAEPNTEQSIIKSTSPTPTTTGAQPQPKNNTSQQNRTRN
jgi:hypothetical protein